MLVEDVLNCNFSSWYSQFKNLTIKSLVLPLDAEFIDYIKSDIFVLPGEQEEEESNKWDSDSSGGEWDVDDYETISKVPEFSELNLLIQEAITQLGNEVFIKLNWNSPKDAAWISTNRSLMCKSFNDICLLLKSSEFIADTFQNSFDHCEDKNINMPNDIKYELILRKWIDIHPGGEFRCFVFNNKLIAISQRNINNYYSYIMKDKDAILSDIQNFFIQNIKDKFKSSNYIFDIYREDKIILIDFSPFCKQTDPILLGSSIYEDPEKFENIEYPLFYSIDNSGCILPDPLEKYSLPKDVEYFKVNPETFLSDLIHLNNKEQPSSSEDYSSNDELH